MLTVAKNYDKKRLGDPRHQYSEANVPGVRAESSSYEQCIVLDVGETWRLARVESVENWVAQTARDQEENAKA